jgi:hypothetical protein
VFEELPLARAFTIVSSAVAPTLQDAPMFAISPLPAIRRFNLVRYSGAASAPMNGSSLVRVSRPVVW